MEQETRIMEPIPAEDEIRITATPWLEEVSDPRGGDTIQWPADSDRDIQHREKVDTPRVRHLFPVPGRRLGSQPPRVRVLPPAAARRRAR